MKSMKDMKFKKNKNYRPLLLPSCSSCPSWLNFFTLSLPTLNGERGTGNADP
jgi:hypothetical protein